MPIFVISGLMLIAAAGSTEAPPAIKAICENVDITLAREAMPSLEIHRLDEEPPAREIKAVVRRIDGCSTPIVVSAQVGVRRR